jgi:hypothetical protein
MEVDPPWWHDSPSLDDLRARQRAVAKEAAITAAEEAAAREARWKLYQAKREELGFPGRNWAIWRRYKAGGSTLKQVGDEFGIGPERVRQIVMRLDRKVKKALNHGWNNVPDEVREATLGVEFVFTNEIALDDYRGWDQLEDEKYGSKYLPPLPEWHPKWGEQDMRPAKPRPIYTYYKVTIPKEQTDD